MNLMYAAGFGFFGGIVRAIIGILKVKRLKAQFEWKYFAFTVVASGVIGMFAGMLVNADYRLTMLAGYAGMDLIEGLYKAQQRWVK